MKKVTLTFVAITLFITASNAQKKAFHKGAVVVDLGIGVSVYKTDLEDAYNSQVWNGSSFTTTRIKKDTTDVSGATVYPLTVEYGLKNWLGVAGRVAYSKYFSEKDSLSGIKVGVRGIDAGLILNLHLIKTNRFDMPIGISLGYSNFKLDSKDSLNSMATDNGINYGFAAVPRFYFGEHIGLSINLGYTVHTYPSVLFSNMNDSNLNNDNDRIFKLKSSGGNIGVSAYKILIFYFSCLSILVQFRFFFFFSSKGTDKTYSESTGLPSLTAGIHSGILWITRIASLTRKTLFHIVNKIYIY